MKIQNMFSSNDWVFGQLFLEAEMVEDQPHGNCIYCYQVGPLGWVCQDCDSLNRENPIYTLRYMDGYHPGSKRVINPTMICRAHRNQGTIIVKSKGESLAPDDDAESVPIKDFPKPREFFQNEAFIQLVLLHEYDLEYY